MSTSQKRTISIPSEQGAFLDQMVASGAYASTSEVVRAGLRALQERDAAVERWLNEEVAPVYDAMKQDPSQGVSAEDAFARVRAHHANKLKATK